LNIQVSVIIAVYNRSDYLKLVLAGFERQTLKDFEIIIADDGSNENVVKEIKNLTERYYFPITHIWHEDKGFRKNKILNKAIISASSGFLIFIDGDCVPHREFVREHVKYKNDAICYTGRRVNLSEKITKILTPEKIRDGYLERELNLIPDGIFGNSYDVEKGFYFRNNFLRKYFNKKKRDLLGCNFSISKDNIMRINGFDERYEAPSIGEDSDVQYRFELNGIKIKSLNNIAVQYHLYHKLQERLKVNLELFEKVKKSGLAFTQFGIEKQSIKS